MAETLLGSAYVDVRARLTNFNNDLKTGIRRSLSESEGAFTAGAAGINRAATDMESGLRSRLANFAEKTGLNDIAGHVNNATSAIGVSLKVAIPAAAALATVEFTKMAGNFQSQLNLLVSAAGESQSAIKGIGDATLAVARATGTGTAQLTTGLYNLEKAGYRGADATNVLRIAAEGARAEGADLGTVVQALTSVMASYHVPASNAVNVMNAIVAAAGESKTSMENFAGALSTVIPIASAAHIDFASVAGAIATLTQHGTSANEATQELSSLIRSLQSPSQVASNAMQQLGINVTRFQQGLSKPGIGLIGSINELVSAITAHMGPAGLVLVSSMKQSQSAAADLQTMLKSMPPNLRSLSQEYLNGTLSLTGYRKEFRGLGAEGSAQGQQFLMLAQKASGFNDLLKSGSPAAQTFVQALKSVSGGAIGLNTMLQLTGENMSGFITRTQTVSKAAQQGGKDIATWGSVQKSFNVVMGQLKQTVETGAISLGQKLLPAVSGAARATASWFSGLGAGGSIFANVQQKFGPFAGAVLFVRAAFDTTVSFIRNTVIPVFSNLIKALTPVWVAIQHGATEALHVLNVAFHDVSDVLTHTIGPALVSASHWFAQHGQVISSDIVTLGQFVLVLGGVGLAIKTWEALTVQAAVVSGVLGDAIAGVRLAFVALSTGEFVEFIRMFTESTIALTIAEGAQAVVTATVTAATKAWAGAQAVLRAVMEGTAISTIVEGAGALLALIPEIIIGIGAWTAAQIGLDVALDANPIGLLALGIAALIAAVAAIVEAILHWNNVMAALSGVLHTIGKDLQDVIGIAKGFVGVVGGIFSLNPKNILKGFEQIGKSIVSIPVDTVKGIASSVGHLFGIGGSKKFTIDLNADQLAAAATGAGRQVAALQLNFKSLDSQLNTDSWANYSGDLDKATNDIKNQMAPLTQLDSLTKGHKTTIDGVTTTQKQWDQALKDTNGDKTAAATLVVGLKDKLSIYQTQLNDLTGDQKTYAAAVQTTSQNLAITTDDVQKYASLMAVSASSVGAGVISQRQLQQAVAVGEAAFNNSTGAVHSFVSALLTYQTSAKGATDQTSLFKAALDALNGNAQDVNVAIAQANQQVDNLVSSVVGALDPSKSFASQLGNAAKGTINLSGAGGQLTIAMSQLHDQLNNVAQATFQTEVHTKGAGVATADAISKYNTLANSALAQLGSQLHLSAAQMATLHQQIDLTPDKKQILLNMFGLTQSTQGVQDLLNKLGALKDKTVTVTYISNVQGVQGAAVGTRTAIGASAIADGGVFNSVRARAYASGGLENHVAQIASPSAQFFRLWAEPETGGEGYIPLAPSKRAGSVKILEAIARMFGGTFLPNIQIAGFADGGITTQYTNGKKYWVYLGRQYSSLAAAENAEVTESRKKTTIATSTIPAFLRSIPGSSIASSEHSLVSAVTSAGGSSALIRWLAGENTQLVKLTTQRQAISDKLKWANNNLTGVMNAYQAESDKVAQGVLSGFDVSTAGNYGGYSTPTSIIAALTQQAAGSTAFAANLQALKAHGLNTTLLTQLGEAGVSTAGANVSALANASADQIATINKLFSQVSSSATGAGNTVADAMYGAGINAAKGLVNGLNSQLAAINRTMTGVAETMVNTIKRELGIHSPSTVGHQIGQHYGQGIVNGISSYARHVGNAAALLAGAASGAPSSSGPHGIAARGLHVTNNVSVSTGASADVIASRLTTETARQVRYQAPVTAVGV